MDYIDTSVLASYYCPDSGSDLMQKTLQKSKRLVLSALTRVELYCALSRKVRDRSLDKDEARKIIALFEKHVRARYYNMLSVRPRDHRQASKWISQFSSPLRLAARLQILIDELVFNEAPSSLNSISLTQQSQPSEGFHPALTIIFSVVSLLRLITPHSVDE